MVVVVRVLTADGGCGRLRWWTDRRVKRCVWTDAVWTERRVKRCVWTDAGWTTGVWNTSVSEHGSMEGPCGSVGRVRANRLLEGEERARERETHVGMLLQARPPLPIVCLWSPCCHYRPLPLTTLQCTALPANNCLLFRYKSLGTADANIIRYYTTFYTFISCIKIDCVVGVLITLIGGLLVFGFANDRFYLCVANVLTTCVFALLAWFGVTRESRLLMAVFFAFAVVEPAFIVGELYVPYNLSI